MGSFSLHARPSRLHARKYERQLDEARGAISTYESTIKDYEGRLSSQANSVQMVEHDAVRAKQLESIVRQLEEEKAAIAEKLDSAQEYRDGFSIAAGRLGAAEQKIGELEKKKEGMIGELEKEKEGMVQAHQFVVATTTVRTSATKRKVDKLKQKCGSANHVQTLTTRMRQKPDEVPHNNGPTTRGRKRRTIVPVKHLADILLSEGINFLAYFRTNTEAENPSYTPGVRV
ncbi:hypothetical protein BJ875DRAFT_544136 [Amylocarpus encephaloides]|uniref:Uncharacterized protein n=1 Tax=Amylocarpus encephaloides TaxID=45428 RepID=A0A9P7YFY8_9HELO|nr:hypothetical protein BJ875DRAFT_544136 [Amylocarpus encephaloides]